MNKYNVMVFGITSNLFNSYWTMDWKAIYRKGIKSFRIKCKTKLYLPNRVCESHPYNYYLDILNDVGIIGTLLFIYLVFSILK